jgi:hypothetical protein
MYTSDIHPSGDTFHHGYPIKFQINSCAQILQLTKIGAHRVNHGTERVMMLYSITENHLYCVQVK